MQHPSRRILMGLAAASAGAATPRRAAASSWRPSRPVRLVVPAPPGGITDIGARLLAARVQDAWGLPCVVDNRAGGGGVIGTAEFLRTAPDGHTMLVGNIGPQGTAYSLFRNLPYTADAFAPTSGLIRGPNVLVVHPSVPAADVGAFIALLRRSPRTMNYGSSGIGQSPHLSGVWFLQLTGTEATHVPFRGSAPALTELLAGNLHFMFENLIAASQHIQAGRLRALAVTAAARSPLFPQLPALPETAPDLASYDVSTWVALFGHAAAPREAIAAWNAEARTMLQAPETASRLREAGSDPHVTTPGEFTAFVAAEIAKWREVIRREDLVLEMN
jgi:tripartite-type tricarboxylate transporter receptor subunit TctC